MPNNTLNTRIKLKYDSLANWISSSFIPLAGEMCVAIIPNTTTNDTTVGSPDSTGLSPYAIGIKVGDGAHTFSQLPWIQAIAGDVYSWAKAADRPSATNINVSYNNGTYTIQQAISGIENSLGNIVTQGVDAATLGQALADLQAQLSGQSTEIFNSNPLSEDETPVPTYPTKIIRTLVQDGLEVTATSSPLVEDDLPNIHLSKISDLAFNSTYNQTTNKVATMADITNFINDSLTKTMTFIGVSSTEIAEGLVENKIYPTIDNTAITNLKVGDVVLYRATKTVGTDTVISDLEFIWTGNSTGWELLGDEGSYAIRGSIKKTDLVQALQTEIEGKLDSTTAASTYVAKNGTDRLMTAAEGTKLASIEENAEANIIEEIQVNGTALTPDANRSVNVNIPLIGLKQHSQYGTTNSTTSVTISNDKTITLDEIAFNGDVKNLKQSDTILIFDCGSATVTI